MSTVEFDEALQAAIGIAADTSATTGLVTIVLRDVFGRCALVVDDADLEERPQSGATAEEMRRKLGPWCAEPPLSWASDLVDPSGVFDDPSRALYPTSQREIGVVERTMMGDGWLRVQPAVDPFLTRPTIVAFASLKGGVGRSTAAAVLARASAASGKCVLLVDLDLESPGLGPLLLAPDEQPDAGVVDVLARAAVGLFDSSDAVERLAGGGGANNGECWILPAGGRPRDGYTYVPKLDRAYTEFVAESGMLHSIASRLQEVIDLAVSAVAQRSRRPDIVLLDCRAGIHDIAGAALTSIADLGLLFASDSAQTWAGYSDIFRQWGARPTVARRLRERLQVVAALVDDGSFAASVATIRDRSYELFSALYDEIPAGEIADDAFSPLLNDEFAPHSPVPITYVGELRSMTPARLAEGLDSPAMRIGFETFTAAVARLIEDLPSNRKSAEP